MSKTKVINFKGKKYHYISYRVEPFSRPDAPCRWRFICKEGVIVAVPLGYFERREPEKIPLKIRRTEWYTTRPIANKERYIKSSSGKKTFCIIPQKATHATNEHVYLSMFSLLLKKLGDIKKNVSQQDVHRFMENMKFEALYDDKGLQRDFFLRVDVVEQNEEDRTFLSESKTQKNKIIAKNVLPNTFENLPDPATRRQVCEVLDMSPASLTNWIRRGWLPKVGRGRFVRFRRSDVIAAFNEYRR